jgi:hypothetical protein
VKIIRNVLSIKYVFHSSVQTFFETFGPTSISIQRHFAQKLNSTKFHKNPFSFSPILSRVQPDRQTAAGSAGAQQPTEDA